MRAKSLARTLLQPIGIAIALGIAVRSAVHIYSIPSGSMLPTLCVGDQVVVTPYFGGEPRRGDIVVFRSPVTPDEMLVKRVIAVPGDLVDSRLGRVRIGGYTAAEPYVLREAASGAISSQVVPADSVFVLGDNREVSIDSRSWGFVPRSAIVGRARLILWNSGVDEDDSARAASSPDRPPMKSSGRVRHLFKWLS